MAGGRSVITGVKAGALADLAGFTLAVETKYHQVAAGGAHVTGEQAEEGTFTGVVIAQQTEDLTGLHFEGYVFNPLAVTIFLINIFRFNDKIAHTGLPEQVCPRGSGDAC